jgi:hypothetical protein
MPAPFSRVVKPPPAQPATNVAIKPKPMTISVIFLPTCDLEFMAFGLLAPLDDRPLGLFTSEKKI